MNDVIEGGSKGGRPRRSVPPALRVAAVVAVGVAVVVFAVVRHSAKRSAAPEPTPTVRPSPIASSGAPVTEPPSVVAFADGGVVGEKGAPWPSATGACGTRPYTPISEFETQFATHYAPTNGSLLIGGAGLRHVTLSSSGLVSTSVILPGLAQTTDGIVDQLVAGPDGEYAVASSCSGSDNSVVYRISQGSPSSVATAAFGQLISGAHHAWMTPALVSAPSASNDEGAAMLRALDGGTSLALGTDSYVVADVPAGLVIGHDDPGNPTSPPGLSVRDPSTGAMLRDLGVGFPLGAQGNSMVVRDSDCASSPLPPSCTLIRIDLASGRPTQTYPLPAGTVPVSNAVFSADAKLMAFQLAQAHPDLRFTAGDTFPPSDVAILNLDSGVVDVIANMEIPEKTMVGLAFDATGRSLFVTVDEGNHSDLLIWQEGMDGPALVTTLAGAVVESPPILALR